MNASSSSIRGVAPLDSIDNKLYRNSSTDLLPTKLLLFMLNPKTLFITEPYPATNYPTLFSEELTLFHCLSATQLVVKTVSLTISMILVNGKRLSLFPIPTFHRCAHTPTPFPYFIAFVYCLLSDTFLHLLYLVTGTLNSKGNCNTHFLFSENNF